MATVEIQGAPPVKYADLTKEKIKKILSQHIVQGCIVSEFALARGSETTH
jgi:(2Fe-2S) ferredoxin